MSFPNPQAALPLPKSPRLEYYKKRAKELLKACRSGDAAIRAWSDAAAVPDRATTDEIVAFARTKLSPQSGVLADAQFVVARIHGFASWPKFAAHITALERAAGGTAAFESAVDAVVAGDEAALARLLRAHPDLVRARSTREHNATLLIYTSANGVEGYRQKSPKNAPAIARMLLDAGAEVDATADVYNGHCTTLGLVATSEPPRIAGVQLPVIDVLLARGAIMDEPNIAGNAHSLLHGCLANGQPAAAEYLADRGARIDIVGAAGIGRVDWLKPFFDARGGLTGGATPRQLADAFAFACGYGRLEAVDYILDRGFGVDTELKSHGDGHTGLHVASYHAHPDVVQRLLAAGADVHAIDRTWKTPPLSWVLTSWARGDADAERCYSTVALLVAAGAVVKPDFLEWDKARADPKMLAALSGRR